jgi:hypothetical protein
VHNDAEEWNAEAPDLKVNDTENASRLFRNHVLGGSTMPEHWYRRRRRREPRGRGGDGRADLQDLHHAPADGALHARGDRHLRAAQGALAANQDDELDLSDEANVVTAEFPEMTARDTTTYATALQQLIAGAAIAIDAGSSRSSPRCRSSARSRSAWA